MFSKALVGLVTLTLACEAVGSNIHRHAHPHPHLDKKAVVTDVAYVTDYVTKTVWIGGEPTQSPKSKLFYTASRRRHSSKVSVAPSFTSTSTSTSTSTISTTSSTSALPTSTPEPEPVTSTTSAAFVAQVAEPSTTLVTSVKPAETTPEPAPEPTPIVSVELPIQVAPVSTTPAAAVTTPATSSTDSSKKRGLAYNDKNLLSGFLGSNSKVSWKYNWAQSDDGGSTGIEFVPMLWGTGPNHEPNWAANAEKAIAAGSQHFLSFNEPDNAGQANMSPETAAAAHIKLVAPYAGRVRIGSPAVTNSNNAGEGIDWLKSFVSACNNNCKLDFVVIHWYNQPNTDEFLQHLVKVHEAVNLPIWITEFAPTGDSNTINSFLQTVMKEMDTNPTYSFVERYSYFMVGTNSLISSGTTLSSFGNTFAYA